MIQTILGLFRNSTSAIDLRGNSPSHSREEDSIKRFFLPKDQFNRHIFILWFILAVVALAFSGIYSFFPYALRTPFFTKYLNLQNLFNLSLMVHVNLGVLVWFMSSSAMLICLVIEKKYYVISFVSFVAAMVGTFFIIVSPFIGDAEPIKNDYIPILHNFCFILGISLFFCAILLQSILCILSYNEIKGDLLKLTIYINSLIFILSVIAFAKSAFELRIVIEKRSMDLLEYYQLLFWGPGHILQFCYVQLLVFSWLVFCFNPKNILKPRIIRILLWVNFIFVALSLLAFWVYPIDSAELYNFFTYHMKYWGGNLIIVIALVLCYNLLSNKRKSGVEGCSFYCSLALILVGGVIGFLIKGANVTVPAHYHGVILGITVSLMGLFYIILPEIGFLKVSRRSAFWQLMTYSFGQLVHVSALAASGGYGVLRKAPGLELSLKAKIFMGIMGIGGTIALIGGVMFVVLIFKNMRGINNGV